MLSNVSVAAGPAPTPPQAAGSPPSPNAGSDSPAFETFDLKHNSEDDDSDPPTPRAWAPHNDSTAQYLNTARSEATDPLLTNP